MLAADGLQGWPLWGKYRGYPVSDTASSHRSTTGHCWTLQPGGDLGDCLRRKRRCTAVRKIKQWAPSSENLERRCSRIWNRYFHIAHGKENTREGKYEGTAARGEKPKIEQVYREGLQPKEWAHPRDGKRVSSRKKVWGWGSGRQEPNISHSTLPFCLIAVEELEEKSRSEILPRKKRDCEENMVLICLRFSLFNKVAAD